jgi:hypothetical protein
VTVNVPVFTSKPPRIHHQKTTFCTPFFPKSPAKTGKTSPKKLPPELACNLMRRVWKTATDQAETRMEVTNPKESFVQQETDSRADTLSLVGIALVVAAIHALTNNRYGFHRDELQFLSDARHLDWGYVAYPPFTPFVERIGLNLFGVSLAELRLFSVLAQALAIVATGLMAWELGGRRLAQITAALVVATSGLPVFQGTEFQY